MGRTLPTLEPLTLHTAFFNIRTANYELHTATLFSLQPTTFCLSCLPNFDKYFLNIWQYNYLASLLLSCYNVPPPPIPTVPTDSRRQWWRAAGEQHSSYK